MKAFANPLISALVSAGTYLMMHYVVGPKLPVKTVEVPPLVGLSPEQARGLLEPSGLLLVLDGERADAKAAPGTLCEQRPLGGSRLRRGDEVHAQLARRPAAAEVPPLAGMTVDAAREALARVHLKLGNVTEAPSDTVARGLVLASMPATGASAGIESTVELTVSSGPAVQAVPAVTGKSLSKAKTLIQQAGFVVGTVKYGSHDDYDTGVVLRQTPAGGAQATPGVKIDLVIND